MILPANWLHLGDEREEALAEELLLLLALGGVHLER